MPVQRPSPSSELRRVRAAVQRGRYVSYLWTFIVGTAWVRTITVRATTLEAAHKAAREKLDDNTYGEEPPVAWDLTLLSCRMSPR